MKHDHKCYCTRQVEKEALKFHFQKQGKAFTSSYTIASQNKANLSSVVSSAKLLLSKSSLSSASKKQSNSLWVDLSFKLANNSKLTSNEYKKHLKNNLYLYYGAEDHKLNFSKKQTTITPKSHDASATASEKFSGK